MRNMSGWNFWPTTTHKRGIWCVWKYCSCRKEQRRYFCSFHKINKHSENTTNTMLSAMTSHSSIACSLTVFALFCSATVASGSSSLTLPGHRLVVSVFNDTMPLIGGATRPPLSSCSLKSSFCAPQQSGKANKAQKRMFSQLISQVKLLTA